MNRRPVPFEIGPVHFIGIGGIGMSGIAEIMMRTGYSVQGSDAKASANTERLQKLGAKIFIGHEPAHVEGAYAVVYSTAVKADNPEMVAGHGLATMVTPEATKDGRSAGSLAWAGLANTYYWVDPVAGKAGTIMTQLLPFADPEVLELFGALERDTYQI